MSHQPPPPQSDEQVVATFTRAMVMFSSMLAAVLLLTLLYLVPGWHLGARGAVLGAVLGLVSWYAPSLIISSQLAAAVRRGPEPAQVPAIVSTVTYIGVSFAEVPALLALVSIFVLGGTDVAAVVVAVPVAVASLWLVVGGPAPVRRHLEQLRG